MKPQQLQLPGNQKNKKSYYTLIVREKQEESQVKEKMEAVVYGSINGEMKIKKTEPSDLVIVIAFDEKGDDFLNVTTMSTGVVSGKMMMQPMAEAIMGLLEEIHTDPKLVSRIMGGFLEELEKKYAEYILQHFTEIFGEEEL